MLPMTNNGALNNGLNNEHNNAHNASRLMALNHGTRGGSHADRRQTDGILICPVSIKPRQFSVHFILLIRYRGRLIGFDLPPRRVARSCAPNSPPRPPTALDPQQQRGVVFHPRYALLNTFLNQINRRQYVSC